MDYHLPGLLRIGIAAGTVIHADGRRTSPSQNQLHSRRISL